MLNEGKQDWRGRLAEISDHPRRARALWLSIAILLSLWHLLVHGMYIDHPELVIDEAGTWGVAQRSLAALLTLPTEFHSQPPLYYFVLHVLGGLDSSPGFLRGISWFFCLLMVQYVLFFLHELNLLGRVFLGALLISADLTHYMATSVRPYAMAAWLVLVSSVWLTRVLREPTRHGAVIYAGWTLAAVYTLAFNAAMLLAHGLFAAIFWGAGMARQGWRPVLQRHRPVIGAMLAIAAGYLPYLAMVVHYQYRDNPAAAIGNALQTASYQAIVREHFGLPTPAMLGLCGLWALAIAGELRARNPTVLLWPALALLQIGFVFYFIVGRSMVLGKYMMPAFIALGVLAAVGLARLVARADRTVWPVVAGGLALFVLPDLRGFHAYLHAPVPVGPFQLMHQHIASQPGRKLVFFDVGWQGQHLEYQVRDDPAISTATMRGPGWASGGDNHLEDAYVIATINDTAARTRCFYYFLDDPSGRYATAFLPALLRLGFTEIARMPAIHGRQVPGFCRDPAGPR